MAKILVDTSAVYALLDRSDRRHAQAATLLKELQRRGDRPILTNFLLGEAYTLLLTRLGRGIAFRWLDANRWHVERVREDDEARAREILRRYDDQDLSYVDATSFAVMERLKIRTAFAFDDDFLVVGFDLVRR
jgi:predicted nucleic acid-binding protein